jgi:hypothetical protein
LAETLETLVAKGRVPVYIVHFTQAEAAESAQDFTSINVCTRDEKAALASALEGFKFTSPYGRTSSAGCATASDCTTPVCCRSIGCWSSNSRRRGCSR